MKEATVIGILIALGSLIAVSSNPRLALFGGFLGASGFGFLAIKLWVAGGLGRLAALVAFAALCGMAYVWSLV